VRKTVGEVFDGGATALYPEAHGCILLSSDADIVLGEIDSFAHRDPS
jgi:hypothetical protein